MTTRGRRGPRRALAGALLAALVLPGCASFRAANQPLERWDPDHGYRASRVEEQRPAGRVLLFLAFSGGGTRAAALSYGVLQELRDTEVVVAGQRERLLDEVDVITSVSGGSFTAAYYGLHGDRIFEDFEDRFLRKNIQASLLLELLRPRSWFRLASKFLDRSELAINLYDERIFDRATFADLLAARGPLLQINATDMAAGRHFTFYQEQFDFLCSDLSSFPVARAVAASSAVPGLFSPIVLENYSGSCGFQRPAWLDEALRERRTNPGRFRIAQVVDGYLDARERPYVHLLDGGIADNIGLRVPLDNVALTGGPFARMQQVGVEHFDHIAVIVVNAEVRPKAQFGLAATSPGLASILGTVSNIQIYGRNADTIELMRGSLKRWATELAPLRGGRPLGTSLVTLGFEDIEDPKERKFFQSLPTSFSLPDTTVDRLIAVARRLLRESPDYRAFLAALAAEARAP